MNRDLKTVSAFASESNGAFTEAQVRWWISQSHANGMADAGVIVRIGKRVYIDRDAFFRWVDRENRK